MWNPAADSLGASGLLTQALPGVSLKPQAKASSKVKAGLGLPTSWAVSYLHLPPTVMGRGPGER